jgi:hypothetical protein
MSFLYKCRYDSDDLIFFFRFNLELGRFSCQWLQAPQRATSHISGKTAVLIRNGS